MNQRRIKELIKEVLAGTALGDELDQITNNYESSSNNKGMIEEWCRGVASWTQELCSDRTSGDKFLGLINTTPRMLGPGRSARSDYDHLIELCVRGYKKIEEMPERNIYLLELKEPVPIEGYIYTGRPIQVWVDNNRAESTKAFAEYAINEIHEKLGDPLRIMKLSLHQIQGNPFLCSIEASLSFATSNLTYNMLRAGVGVSDSLDFYTTEPSEDPSEAPSEWSQTYSDYKCSFVRLPTGFWTWLGINAIAYGEADTDIFAVLPDDVRRKLKGIATDFPYSELNRYQTQVRDSLNEIKRRSLETRRESEQPREPQATEASVGLVTASEAEYIFRRDDKQWKISYKGNQASVKDRSGMLYIAYLLQNPRRWISPFKLERAVKGLTPDGRSFAGEVPMLDSDDSSKSKDTICHKEADAVLDLQCVKEFRQAILESEIKIENARRQNDEAMILSFTRDKEMIEDQLAQYLGKYDKLRKFNENQSTTSNTISRAITRSLESIQCVNDDLYVHLNANTKRGSQFAYEPATEILWDLG